MELLATSSFTANQKQIISMRIESKTYTQNKTAMNIATELNTRPKQISKCLQRSALGYAWDYEQSGGR